MARFSSDFQPMERKKRGPDKRTMMLRAIMDNLVRPDGTSFESEEEAEQAMLAEVVKRAVNSKDPSSSQLMKEVLIRLAPPDKATLPVFEFKFRSEGSAAEKISDVQTAVADGLLPVDIGNTMVNIIVSGIKVFEVTELAERLERIEQLMTKEDE